MAILVTGGLGFIGSHTVVALIENGYKVVIADNLSNSQIDVLEKLEHITGEVIPFYEVDVTNESKVNAIFSQHTIEGVIHFAGYKAVGESVEKPLMYYANNLMSTIAVMNACLKHNVKKFVFSSSATVYGDNAVPFKETMTLLPTTNPYGETKAMCERILTDTAKANPQLEVTLLRYFNPIGAHKSGLIGEKPNGIPNNLMPYITQVASGEREYLQVFGNDYDTPDGTGVRDYIHVVDLAEGHVAAMKHSKQGAHAYNLGTGKGTSVLELVQTFERVNNIKVPYKIVERRAGDLAECYADAEKASRNLQWKTKLCLQDMCFDAWNFENNLKLVRK